MPSSSSPAPNDSDADTEAASKTSEMFKRLSASVNKDIRQRKRAQGSFPEADESDLLKPFKHQARWIGRSVDPSLTIPRVIAVGFAYDTVESIAAATGEPAEVPDDPQVQMMSQAERDLYRSVYKRTCATLPSFVQYLEDFANNPTDLNNMLNTLELAKKQSRADDISTIKGVFSYIIEHVLLDAEEQHWAANRNKLDDHKTARGFNDTIFGRLLCPHRLSEEYAKDPSGFCQKVKAVSSTYPITAASLPALLYDRPFNPSDIGDGLLWGKLPILCFKAIFTSPTSVKGKDGGDSAGSRSSIAQLYGLTRATPNTIAYACMLARFLCSSHTKWSVKDGKFNYYEFYYLIVEMFDDPDEPWVIDVLDHWDAEIFHRAPRRTEASLLEAATAAGMDSDMRLLKEQRKARKIAVAKAAADKAAAEKAAADKAAAEKAAARKAAAAKAAADQAALEKAAFGGDSSNEEEEEEEEEESAGKGTSGTPGDGDDDDDDEPPQPRRLRKRSMPEDSEPEAEPVSTMVTKSTAAKKTSNKKRPRH